MSNPAQPTSDACHAQDDPCFAYLNPLPLWA